MVLSIQGRAIIATIAGVDDESTLFDGVGNHSAEQAPRPDGVVVARDEVLDHIRIAVGVDHGDDRNAQLVRLGHRYVLLHGVQDEDGVGQALHVLDATQVALELHQLAAQQQGLLLGHRLELAGVAHALVLLHLGYALRDRLEVREHAAQPPLVHIGHAALLGVGTDGVLGLALRADEQHPPAIGDEIADERVRGFDPLERLLEVDDVDTRPLAVDESPHPRIPTAGLVSEVDACLEQLLHGHDCHVVPSLPIGSSRPHLAPGGDRGWMGVFGSGMAQVVPDRA